MRAGPERRRWTSGGRAQQVVQQAWRGQPWGGEGEQIHRVDEAFWMMCVVVGLDGEIGWR